MRTATLARMLRCVTASACLDGSQCSSYRAHLVNCHIFRLHGEFHLVFAPRHLRPPVLTNVCLAMSVCLTWCLAKRNVRLNTEHLVMYYIVEVCVQVQHAQAVAASMNTNSNAMPSVEDAFQQLDMDNYDNEPSDVVSRLLQVRYDAAVCTRALPIAISTNRMALGLHGFALQPPY